MTSRQIRISGGTWYRRDQPAKDIVYLTMLTGIAALVSVVLLRPTAEVVAGTLSLATLVMVSVFFAKSASSNVEIDRNKGEIRTARNFPVITYRRSYPLRVFDTVVLAASDEPVEGGYRFTRYSVVLSGKGKSLEVFSADTESEGKAVRKELAAFLALPTEGCSE